MVSEWSFKKDGVDAGMIDLANETRGAQLDDRDTFLGIGQKRYISQTLFVWQLYLTQALACGNM